MPVTTNPKHIFEPTNLQCGQAVLAMLTDKSVEEIIDIVKTDRETTLKQMFDALQFYEISFARERKSVTNKQELPPICILSLETPHCWHWSLYYKGTFYDPEYGVLEDFPPSARRYYWQINENS
ncbi:MAG: hypothetical protein IKT93_03080 [Clostridia bacterium]|nr:hypothetical protein [Clostridia bacterium]